MTRTTTTTSTVQTPAAWRARDLIGHWPLLILAAGMGVLTVVAAAGLMLDSREILGQPVWAKPLKFAISIGVYALTLSWMLRLLTQRRRVAWWIGTITAGLLWVEIVIVTGAAMVGERSHFNVSTPLSSMLYSVMGVSIAVVWLLAAALAVLLLRQRLGDSARKIAVRVGLGIGLAGMALAFLMTSPTSEQLNDFQGIAGAHAVGVADGGQGLPLLGWSIEGGDLRVPHFVGMHALQVLPLFALGLELLAGRVLLLRQGWVRGRLLAIAAVGYTSLVAIVTWQALRGQSVVYPDAVTIVVSAAVFAVLAFAVGLVWKQAAGHHGRTHQRKSSGLPVSDIDASEEFAISDEASSLLPTNGARRADSVHVD